ncbi:hypothetical protein AOQ84DRAFT_256364, partial [Glonium stellatum]
TLWLFTYSDLKTMVIPSTAFALFNGYAKFSSDSITSGMACFMLARRTPFVLIWAWVNCLAFNVNNQRRAWSIEEDRINKPWRPMPAHRLSEPGAKILGVTAYSTALLVGSVVGGGTIQSAFLLILGYLYNDLRGGDKNVFARNVLNGFGFTSFASGALDVAMQFRTDLETLSWLLLIALVVSTTIHTQDLYDQAGDSAIGRRTLPLVIGDSISRWMATFFITIWSWMCPFFWRTTAVGYLLTTLLGTVVCLRLLVKRSVREDKNTFILYNGWLVSLYLLPLFAS